MQEVEEFIDNVLSEKGIDRMDLQPLASMVGRWVSSETTQELYNFTGNYINYGTGWLLVGDCDTEVGGRPGKKSAWTIEYLSNKDLIWTISLGQRSHTFPNAYNNPEIEVRIDVSGTPVAIVLNATIPRHLRKTSYLTFQP